MLRLRIASALALAVAASVPIPAQVLAGPVATPGPAHSHQLQLGSTRCRLVGVPTSPLGVAESCPGVRPGAIVGSPIGLCTFNFMLLGSDGRTYMGTAGHCILEGTPFVEARWGPGTGPVAIDGDGNRVGEFAFAVLRDELDFSLVRLDPAVAASAGAGICHFGGPTGINADQPNLPTVLEQFGQGEVVGGLVPGRTEVALGMPSATHVFATGVVTPGDSGSPVVTGDGRAVGLVVTLGVATGGVGLGGLDAGIVGIVRIAPQLAEATSYTHVGYVLQTAPLTEGLVL